MRKGPIIVGASLFGGGYLLATTAGAQGAEEMFIPVVGPFLAIGNISGGTGEFEALSTFGVLLLVGNGVLQSVGLGTLIYGLTSREQVLVRNEAGVRSIRVAPVRVGRDGWGVGLTGRL